MNADPLEPRPHVLSQNGGRVIAWHEFGQTESPRATALYCHGTPGTGYEALFLDAAARELGIRLIAIDRPGLGASDAVDERAVSTWAEQDVAAVVEHLQLEEFGVMGFSGGGPHAMAVAAIFPGAVTRLVLLAPFTHHPLWESRLGVDLTATRVLLSHLFLSWMPKPLIDRVAGTRPAQAHRRPLGKALSRDVQGHTGAYRMAVAHDYALQFDISGGVQDEHAIYADWGFSETQIKVPVHVWVPEKDLAIRPARARNLGLRLGAQLHELPEDGHLSLLINHGLDVLKPLVDEGP
ncbi:alpha/beta fold hydrolase [Rothia nasimurium]|uniref:alpha/beta fold hydrolase n=1 Tax=Rothia nasimurium TaxID=85336 RepID=UPI001F2AF2F7|nr:alpha/beta hydrolase [Rothia nasimurium]